MTPTLTVTRDDLEVLDSCPVCDGTTFEALASVSVIGGASPVELFETVLCTWCGLVFRRIRPQMAWYERSRDLVSPTNDADQELRTTYKRYAALADALAASGVRQGRVVDIGCGFGGGLKAFLDRGWDVVGLEPQPVRSQHSDDLGIEIVAGTLEQNPFDRGSFDLVVMSHVLEHVHDPVAAVSAVRSLLTDGGLFYVEVPDVDHSLSWSDAFHLQHLSVFSPENLAHTLRRGGLRPVQLAEADVWWGRCLGMIARRDQISFEPAPFDGPVDVGQRRRCYLRATAQCPPLDFATVAAAAAELEGKTDRPPTVRWELGQLLSCYHALGSPVYRFAPVQVVADAAKAELRVRVLPRDRRANLRLKVDRVRRRLANRLGRPVGRGLDLTRYDFRIRELPDDPAAEVASVAS